MDGPHFKYTYFSVASASAIMVGDPRNLSASEKAFYKKWNSWFRKMDAKFQFTRYMQQYDIFDRPTNENWDGSYRINTKIGGGVLFFFRNNSADSKRQFRIPFLEADCSYRITSPETGKIVGRYKGRELINKGISIFIGQRYSAKVLGIEKINGN